MKKHALLALGLTLLLAAPALADDPEVAPSGSASGTVEGAATAPAEPGAPTEEAAPAGELLDGVVAVVNGDVVTVRDLDDFLRRSGGVPQGVSVEVLAARRREALEQQVREILVIQTAREMGIDVSDAEVDEHLDRIQKENHFTRAQLETSLKRVGFQSLTDYRDVVRREMLKSHVVSIKVRARLKVSDAEVAEVLARDYNGGQDEWEIRCAHLMLRVDAFAPDPIHKEARERLGALRGEIVAGTIAFDEAARTRSEDVTARDGGDLGWFTTGTLEESFEKVAFTIQPGVVSDVVQTPFGYHLILVHERRRVPISEQRRAALDTSVRERLYQEKYLSAMTRWFEQLEASAEVKKLIEL